jgi:hypothetical protein
MLTDAEIEKRFNHHPPTGNKADTHTAIRAACKELALKLNKLPNSRELSLAFTHLEETMMWANAAIARNPEPS